MNAILSARMATLAATLLAVSAVAQGAGEIDEKAFKSNFQDAFPRTEITNIHTARNIEEIGTKIANSTQGQHSVDEFKLSRFSCTNNFKTLCTSFTCFRVICSDNHLPIA